jgi:4-amino-4-deoxy-L-arabinose transferase-like glycosyltransferase
MLPRLCSGAVMRIREAAILFVVLCIAGWLRYVSATQTLVEVPIRNDAKEYVAYAYNLQRFGVYSKAVTWNLPANTPAPVPDAMRPPAYPAFLLLFLHGRPDLSFINHAVAAQAILGMFVVLGGYLLARLILGWPAAMAVAVLLGTSPQLVIYESYLLTETLYTFAVTAALLAGTVALRTESPRRLWIGAAIFGALLAFAALIRPTLQHLPFVLLGAALLIARLRRYRLAALVMSLSFAVAVAPWALRNLVVTGHVSDPRLAIATLQGGSYPYFMYDHDPKTYGGPSTADPRSAEISQSMATVLTEIARKFRSSPVEYLSWYLVGKPIAFFSLNEISGWGWVFIYPVLTSPFLHDPAVRFVSAITTGLHWPLVLCAVAGMFAAWTSEARRRLGERRALALRFVSAVFAFAVALHVVGTPLPRYSVPFRPLFYVLAVYAISAGWTILKVRLARPGHKLPSAST